MLAMDPRVVNAVWKSVEGHLPPRPPDLIRWVVTARGSQTVTASTGSWPDSSRAARGTSRPDSARQVRPRSAYRWLQAGVFDYLLSEAFDAYDRVISLDLSDIAVDGSLHKAPCGGEGTGPNPTDRGKLGWKWSIATDRRGIPLGWVIDGANRHDSILLEPTLRAVANSGLPLDVGTLHLERGYDSNLTL